MDRVDEFLAAHAASKWTVGDLNEALAEGRLLEEDLPEIWDYVERAHGKRAREVVISVYELSDKLGKLMEEMSGD